MADSYCAYVAAGACHPAHIAYHDGEYGYAVSDDRGLFERLILEINQAGLSWETILKRRAGFLNAYDQFDVNTVASYRDEDVQRLLNDPGIIRNRAKVEAAVRNAQAVLRIQEHNRSFKDWLDAYLGSELSEWTKLFRKTFVFTGPEIVREFLVSSGYLPGAHDKDCPVYARAVASNPPWIRLKLK